MCGGVYFKHGDDVLRVFYPNPKAVLPVLMADGKVQLIAWGRRQKQPGKLPMTGWARLDSIYSGRWDKYFPKPIKIPVLSFMEKDLEGVSHWYDLQKGQYIGYTDLMVDGAPSPHQSDTTLRWLIDRLRS
jgi:hypothetical protein